MKLLTILGTRPEIIRLSCIIPKLDKVCEQRLLWTGQNYNHRLSSIFFKELGVRKPDYSLRARGCFGEQAGIILMGVEWAIKQFKPDKFLVLGDTNSSLGAIMAKKMGVTVYHMEAGNRCYFDEVPEEVNRRIIDHTSDILMPYTTRSRQNLLDEGIPNRRIFVTGNPIGEVIAARQVEIRSAYDGWSGASEWKRFFLATFHRAENVDNEKRLRTIISGLEMAGKLWKFPVVVSLHPHTKKRIEQWGIKSTRLNFQEPMGFFTFANMEQGAACVMTDSGTVQEECALFKTPVVTVRDSTERPETIESGGNILSGVRKAGEIVRCVQIAMSKEETDPPSEYVYPDVSERVKMIVCGHNGG